MPDHRLPPTDHMKGNAMTQITINVPEIHCDHCKTSLEGAIGVLTGVDSVKVSVPEATIEVSFDQDTVDVSTIKSAIDVQGYAVAD